MNAVLHEVLQVNYGALVLLSFMVSFFTYPVCFVKARGTAAYDFVDLEHLVFRLFFLILTLPASILVVSLSPLLSHLPVSGSSSFGRLHLSSHFETNPFSLPPFLCNLPKSTKAPTLALVVYRKD